MSKACGDGVHRYRIKCRHCGDIGHADGVREAAQLGWTRLDGMMGTEANWSGLCGKCGDKHNPKLLRGVTFNGTERQWPD